MKSHASASSQPPPSAKPLTSAIVGNGASSSARITAWPRIANSRPSSGDMSRIAAMSAPATNAFSPAPVTSSTRAEASVAAWTAAPMSARTCGARALSACGRLTVRRKMPGARSSNRIVW